MGGYLFDTGILYLAGVSHNMWSFEDFVSDNLILKIVIHRTIDKLVQLGDGDGGDDSVVCITLYFIRLHLYAVNSKGVPWEERKFYHWSSLLWFNIFYRCE